jgi:hypothetical protein
MSDIHDAIAQAKARYEAMSHDEQAAMWKAQRESWVRAFTTPCEHGELDFEQCQQCRSAALANIGKD